MSELRELREKMAVPSKELDHEDVVTAIRLISKAQFKDADIVRFLSRLQAMELDVKCLVFITEAMRDSGRCYRSLWKCKGPFFDKHGVGGTPGDSTSLLVVPICASAGLRIPKVSSSAITTSAGHADIMNAICKVDISFRRAAEVLKNHYGFLLWSGSPKLNIVPVDRRIVNVQHRYLPFDFKEIFIPSILSKKAAIGSDFVVIDISWGPDCKISSKKEATNIAGMFRQIGKHLGMTVETAIFHETEPLGRFVGPRLQAWECLEALKNKDDSPLFVSKGLQIATRVFDLANGKDDGNREKVMEIFSSGQAYKKLKEIASAQGLRNDVTLNSPIKRDFKSRSDGVIKAIRFRPLNRVASMVVGNHGYGPQYQKDGSGIEIHVKVGQRVKKGDKLFSLHMDRDRRISKKSLASIVEIEE